jgi:hypothetical protein
MKTKAKLKFIDDGETWSMIVEDLEANVLQFSNNIVLFEEQKNKEYFDNWENQVKLLPDWEIIEVERFI